MERQGRKTARTQQEALPQEYASAVNLLAHPVAGAAAAGALGIGLAGHALGLWLGAMAGAAEASRRMLDAGAAAPAQPKRPAALRLVAAQPAPHAPAAKPREHKPTPRAVGAVAAVSAAKKPSGIARPAAPDDLKAISGIGPKLEKVLNGLGIWSYRQIEALGEAEIAWLDDHLGFSGRIGRDDWRGQAKRLSGGR